MQRVDQVAGLSPVKIIRSAYFAETKACAVFDEQGRRLGFLVVTTRSKGITLSTITEYEATHKD